MVEIYIPRSTQKSTYNTIVPKWLWHLTIEQIYFDFLFQQLNIEFYDF
jgi:hypothetical protein